VSPASSPRGWPERRPWRALLESPVVANSGALIALRATNLGARLLVLFLIARQVPAAAFGLVVYAVSIAEIAKVIADFGMDTLAIREYAAQRDSAAHGRFAASLGAAKVAFGAVVYLALIGYFALTQSSEQAALGFIVGGTVATALLANFSIDYFQARLRIGRVLIPVLATNVALTLAAAWLLPRIHDLRIQAAFFPALEGATGLVLLASLRRETPLGGPRLAFDRVAELARRSLPLAVTAIVIMAYSRMDVLVLSSRLDSAAVGYYGIAFRMTEPFQIAAAAFGLSVFSRFSSWFQEPQTASVRGAATRYLLATLGYGVATAGGLSVIAPLVIERALPGYTPAIPILRILAAALVFRTLNATLAGIIQGAGRFRLLTLIATWNLALVLGLLLWLVNRLQAPGAALALLIAEGVNSGIQLGVVALIVARPRRATVLAE
jgi:O-antigen/teichoic acid export membrane protein